MNHDEANDLLDELIDETLDDKRAEAVREHIKECEDCKTEARSIKILSLALGKLPTEALRPDEKSSLVGASREAAVGRASKRMPVMGWLAAAAVIVVVLAVGIPLLVSSPNKTSGSAGTGSVQSEQADAVQEADHAKAAPSLGSGPLPVVITKGGSYSDTAEVDRAVRANPNAAAFLGRYQAGDVGALQRQFQEYVKEQAPVSEGRSPAECMNLVFRSVPRPILPAYVERAHFEGQDAWVLAFAFTDNTAADAPLSEVLIYVLAQGDCNFLSTASYR